MNFLYPAFLVGAALIAIPVVLHLLRRDTAPAVPFTAVRLLRKSPLERSQRRRLRDLILLAARVTALLLLAGAFARPYLAGDAKTGDLRIVAIDRSFSMGAPGQFSRAIELARTSIDEAGSGERVAVIAFDERADVVATPGTAADARSALAELKPGFGGTKYGVVMAKASELADGARGRLTLITDLQRAGWEEQARGRLPAGFTMDVRDVGALPSNLGVVAVRMEPARIVSSIRNAGPEARSGELRAMRDGRAIASARYSVPADSIVDVAMELRPPADGSIAVSLDDAAGIEADNTRYVMLAPVARPAALIVTGGGDARSGFYLTRAIDAASDGSDGFEPRIVSGAQLGAMTPEALGRYRAIVLLSTRGMDRRARGPVGAFVRGGGGVLVAASPDVDPSVLSMMLDWQPALPAMEQEVKTTLSPTDLRHPIFRPFGSLAANLGHVRFDRSWRIKSGDWQVAARFSDGTPALLERSEGQGRVVLFASDFDRRWNDFPLHATFVPFVAETLRHVAGAVDDRREYVVARVPPGVPAQPGVYTVAHRTVAVNVDPREGGIARLTEDEFRGMVDTAPAPSQGSAGLVAQQAESRQNYWRYALMLMLGVLVIESVVGKA